MKKTYIDELYFEKEVEVEENSQNVIKRLNIFQRFRIGYLLKTLLYANKELINAFIQDIDYNEIESFFSDDAAQVLKKIKRRKNVNMMSYHEVIIFVSDFVMPIAYGKTELEKNQFKHASILLEAKVYWNSIREDIRKIIFSNSYIDNYKEITLNKEEMIQYKISRDTYLRTIMTPCIDISWNFNKLIKYRSNLTEKEYAFCIRVLYKAQTKSVPLELLYKAFEGLAKEDIMLTDEMRIYNSLPDEICVYRGTDANEELLRPSWTLNLDVAKKFSHGKLLKARICKERIIAFFNDVEDEVLVWINGEEAELL